MLALIKPAKQKPDWFSHNNVPWFVRLVDQQEVSADILNLSVE